MTEQADTNAADAEGDRLAADKVTVDLHEWPDELIRAVAIEAPALFRSGDHYAVREERFVDYAADLALVSLEKEDLTYVDLAAYAAEIREQGFRRFDLVGAMWYVADWDRIGEGKREPDIELPTSAKSLSVEEWPDALIAAVGQQAPALLRTERGDAWAVADDEFERFANFWLFEGYCDSMLYPHVDVDRYIMELRSEFTEVTVSDERWYVHVGESDDDVSAPSADADERDGLRLLQWPDQLVAAVAAALPQVFRTNDYEMILAVSDGHLAAVVADWAVGQDAEIEQAGDLAAWSELVIAEDFRSVEIGDQRWWVYICDWEPLQAAAVGA